MKTTYANIQSIKELSKNPFIITVTAVVEKTTTSWFGLSKRVEQIMVYSPPFDPFWYNFVTGEREGYWEIADLYRHFQALRTISFP